MIAAQQVGMAFGYATATEQAKSDHQSFLFGAAAVLMGKPHQGPACGRNLSIFRKSPYGSSQLEIVSAPEAASMIRPSGRPETGTATSRHRDGLKTTLALAQSLPCGGLSQGTRVAQGKVRPRPRLKQ
jgi:hypothetical protein